MQSGGHTERAALFARHAWSEAPMALLREAMAAGVGAVVLVLSLPGAACGAVVPLLPDMAWPLGKPRRRRRCCGIPAAGPCFLCTPGTG